MNARIAPYRLGLLLAVAASILFGLYPPAVRAVYAKGGDAVFMMLASTWARALGLAAYCLLTRRPLFQTREDTRQAAIGGVFQALTTAAIMAALTFMPGPLVIMVVFTHSLMLLLFLVWKGEVRLDAATLGTTLTALGGLGLVLDIWHAQPVTNLWGIALAFAAALTMVMRMYVYGQQTRERNPAVVGAENFLLAALFILLVLLFKWPRLPQSGVGQGWVLLACAAMALATFIMFYGISLLGSFGWSLFAKLEPIFTALFSLWLIHEILKPHQYLGMVVIVASLVFYQTRNRPRQKS